MNGGFPDLPWGCKVRFTNSQGDNASMEESRSKNFLIPKGPIDLRGWKYNYLKCEG